MEDITGGINTIGKVLRYTAQTYEDKTAIKYMTAEGLKEHSYRSFYEDSLSVGAYLKTLCPDKMHIALIAATNYRFLTAINASMLSGNVAVPFAPDIAKEEAVMLLDDCDASFVITDFQSFESADEIFTRCPKVKFVLDIRDDEKFSAIYSRECVDEIYLDIFDEKDETAAIIYTSGTTGRRKGAVLSSYALVSNIFFKEMNFEGDNVALNVLPLHHIFSFSCDYLKNLKDGVTICLNLEKSRIFNDFLTFEPSVVRLVPMIFDAMCRRVRMIRKRRKDLSPREAAEQVFGRRLHSVIISGAAFSPEAETEFVEMGLEVRQGYGMTETGPRIAVPDGKTCIQSGGRVISICQARIVDGEIQVKSPSLMTGYYKLPKETEEVFTEDGYLRTGDLGRLTEDNELFITGRIKNVIILSNGENVSPEEIEIKYVVNPLVREIIVYENNGGIAAKIYPDFEYAEKNGINVEEAINELVRQQNAEDIAAREIDKVEIVNEPLPKTKTGKILRKL